MFVCKRITLGSYLTPYIKFNPNWISDLNIKATSCEILSRKDGALLCDLKFGSGILNCGKDRLSDKNNMK